MADPTYDLLVLGTGSGGEVAAGEVARAGGTVAAVDSGLVGGECAYVACVPSKAMLLSARQHLTQGGDHDDAFAKAIARRDEASEHRDDSGTLQGLQDDGVEVIRGRAVLAGRVGDDLVVEVQGRRLRAKAVVIGTGSEPVIPPLTGLDNVPTWTRPGPEQPGPATPARHPGRWTSRLQAGPDLRVVRHRRRTPRRRRPAAAERAGVGR